MADLICNKEGCNKKVNYWHGASEQGWCYKHFIKQVMGKWGYSHLSTEGEPKEDGEWIATLPEEKSETT